MGLAAAVGRDPGGISVVLCADRGRIARWCTEVRGLVDEGIPIDVTTAEEALANPHRLALLVPRDEQEAVQTLDARRDETRRLGHERTQPIVLFLTNGGDGLRELQTHAFSLASIVDGAEAVPDEGTERDLTVERQRFLEERGQSADAWLAAWVAGTVPDTLENHRISYRAAFLRTRGT
jgi:hypothetical protein